MARTPKPIHWEAVAADAAEAGDFFQVEFRGAGGEERSPYILIQRQFEFPDDGKCYIEYRPPEDAGHFRVQTAYLDRDQFKMSFGKEGREVTIGLNGKIDDYTEFCRILQIVIPEIKILK
jgi:hypothetical protein